MDDHGGGEFVVLRAEQIFKWDGPKRKQTMFKAKLGRLLLTDRRLLFLSTGSNDLSGGKLARGAVSSTAVLRVSSTETLDLSALHADGGLELPRERIRNAELKGMFKYLTITWADDSGASRSATFALKNGGMPGGADWVAELNRT
jgi:hypothetical protein